MEVVIDYVIYPKHSKMKGFPRVTITDKYKEFGHGLLFIDADSMAFAQSGIATLEGNPHPIDTWNIGKALDTIIPYWSDVTPYFSRIVVCAFRHPNEIDKNTLSDPWKIYEENKEYFDNIIDPQVASELSDKIPSLWNEEDLYKSYRRMIRKGLNINLLNSKRKGIPINIYAYPAFTAGLETSLACHTHDSEGEILFIPLYLLEGSCGEDLSVKDKDDLLKVIDVAMKMIPYVDKYRPELKEIKLGISVNSRKRMDELTNLWDTGIIELRNFEDIVDDVFLLQHAHDIAFSSDKPLLLVNALVDRYKIMLGEL